VAHVFRSSGPMRLRGHATAHTGISDRSTQPQSHCAVPSPVPGEHASRAPGCCFRTCSRPGARPSVALPIRHPRAVPHPLRVVQRSPPRSRGTTPRRFRQTNTARRRLFEHTQVEVRDIVLRAFSTRNGTCTLLGFNRDPFRR
jgi:hypothetical protein